MKETQKTKILNYFNSHVGEWINGRFFNDTLHITQFHTRIHELQKEGYQIEGSTFKDDYGFKSYRLIDLGVKMDRSTYSTSPKEAPLTTCCYSFSFYGFHSKECMADKVTIKEEGMLF